MTIEDGYWNVVPDASGPVIVSLGTNPGGGTLSGTPSALVTNGRGVFPNLSVDKAGVGYTLVASATTCSGCGGNWPSPRPSGAISTAFTIVPGPVATVRVNPSAAALNFVSGPNSVQLVATPVDAFGNATVGSATWSSGGPAATVSSTGLVTGVGGIATITASSGGRTGTATVVTQCGPPRCSVPGFGILQPGTARAGDALPPVQAGFSCAFGCGTSSTWTVSLLLGNNPGGATLTGNSDKQASFYSETVTWSNLRIDKPGTYTLVAIVSGTDILGATSGSFTITP